MCLPINKREEVDRREMFVFGKSKVRKIGQPKKERMNKITGTSEKCGFGTCDSVEINVCVVNEINCLNFPFSVYSHLFYYK